MTAWRKRMVAVVLGAGAVWSMTAPLAAQRIEGLGTATVPRTGTDALERYLFTPELIMRHYREIDLEPSQRETITRAVEELQVGLVDLQWRLMESTQQLEEALDRASIDEGRAVALVDQVLAMEREVKTRHLTALIRIKNALTEEQQAELRGRGGPRVYLNVPFGINRSSQDTTVSPDSVGVVRGRLIRVNPDGSGRVSGRVSDRENGRPLAGAQVMLPASQTGVLTRDDGRFLMTSVPGGAQTIRVQLVGYAPAERTVTVTEDGTVTLNVELGAEGDSSLR